MPQDYNETLNLPETGFPMRAGLPQREPETLAKWQNDRVYHRLQEKNADKPAFILHDGPPFANGDIHLGTAMNKILKDMVVKYKAMSGYRAPFVPGWDTHGLPIELKALKKLNVKENTLTPLEIRKCCREFAEGYVESQKQQFIRLGVWGDFEDPYVTLANGFEAEQIKVFGDMALKGYIYKGKKPVYWCADCGTALAEAEIEYADDPCTSIYVKFRVRDDMGKLAGFGVDLKNTYFVIWTTTTWTLPGNVAICLGPDFTYQLVKAGDEVYVIAKELVENVMKIGGRDEYTVLGEIKGQELEGIVCSHPFFDRDSLVIVGDHVTLDSGTGCIHTAPGHGMEDYIVCKNYPQLSMPVPVDDHGRMNEEAGKYQGLKTADANKAIYADLEASGALFASEQIVHQYPHCWRCRKPILYRATNQWFCSVESFKDETLKAIDGVRFIPAWGKERMASMVRDRADWCISRQRKWGVPITMFTCAKCGKPYITKEVIDKISDLFAQEGSDAWYSHPVEDLLPAGAECECGSREFDKEVDVMDGWFDSGSTHAAVLETRADLSSPADLYLEGGDQYRGWFQSSLLTSVATRGRAPYKTILTHGWVIDEEKRKMSKSLGNGIAPEQIIKDFGADILRLWVASSDYTSDVKISKDLLKQLSESYRKIRNTAKYMLGVLKDFKPDENWCEEYKEIDRWALSKLDELIAKVKASYEEYQFHAVFHAILQFCTVDLSNTYLDILKDRLYVEAPADPARRAAQTAVYQILDALTRMLAPILAFTADEIWSFMPHRKADDITSVVFNDFPAFTGVKLNEKQSAKWEKIFALREDVLKALEAARNAKLIGSSLEAKVALKVPASQSEGLTGAEKELADIFIVSQVELLPGEGDKILVDVAHAEGEKCVRCWVYSTTVGHSHEHPELCECCVKVMDQIKNNF